MAPHDLVHRCGPGLHVPHERELHAAAVEVLIRARGAEIRVAVEEVVAVKIEEQVLSDRGMVEDLVMTAMNEGIKKAKKLRETEMVKVTWVSMPGMF